MENKDEIIIDDVWLKSTREGLKSSTLSVMSRETALLLVAECVRLREELEKEQKNEARIYPGHSD